MTQINVGIAEMNVVFSPSTIRTTGLGSCVGVALYDASIKLAGLVHIMLPTSELAKGEIEPAKYADTAIPALVAQMEKAGANRSRMMAKMAGGAQMFQNKGREILRIGPRNVEAALKALKLLRIPVLASDTGGNYGRTIEIEAETGRLHIWTVFQGDKII